MRQKIEKLLPTRFDNIFEENNYKVWEVYGEKWKFFTNGQNSLF